VLQAPPTRTIGAMPIKMWDNTAQGFVDASTGELLTVEELADLIRTLPPTRKAEISAFAQALLLRRDRQEPH
jgi:hypothetical protein